MLSALVLLGGSAFAAFTTTAVAQSDTFSTTTPNLTVQVDNAGADAQTVPGITVSGLVPGGPAGNHNFTLSNHDSVNAYSVSLNFNDTGSTLPGGDTTIIVNCGQGAVSDSYSGWVTGHFVGNISASGALACTMSVSLNSGVGNSDIGLSDHFDAVFTGSVGN